ncbi:hypothetical protein GALMADRAFT_81317, partial [Galerina marginata CBS 339.88]
DYWVVAPYKAPENNCPRNTEFNNHVSILRIWSEHAIGYLKGRFQSLKGLHIQIKDETTHIIATIGLLHALASIPLLSSTRQRSSIEKILITMSLNLRITLSLTKA